MSDRWGNLNKKSIVFVLETGIDHLRDSLKEDNPNLKSLWEDYGRLKRLLYGDEVEELLSLTNQVKFETNLRAIKKKLDRLDNI